MLGITRGVGASMEQVFPSMPPRSSVPGGERARHAPPRDVLPRSLAPPPRHAARSRRRRAGTSERPYGVRYCFVTRKLAVPLASRNWSRTVHVPGTPAVVANVPFSPSER